MKQFRRQIVVLIARLHEDREDPATHTRRAHPWKIEVPGAAAGGQQRVMGRGQGIVVPVEDRDRWRL